MSCCQDPVYHQSPRAHSQLCASVCFPALLRAVLGYLGLWDEDGAQGWIIADKWCDDPKKCRERSWEILLFQYLFLVQSWKQQEHWGVCKILHKTERKMDLFS